MLDEREQMTALLGTLARCVASGRSLNQDELRTLLRDVGLEPDPGLLVELEHWTRLLHGARFSGPDDPASTATIEALTQRGIAEASAVLAVATATAAISHSHDTGLPGVGGEPTSGDQPTTEARWPRALPLAGRESMLIVAADGSGSHRSLASALDVAAPGATILLKSGVHYLKRGYLLQRPVSIVGEGLETTELVTQQGNFVLGCHRQGLFQIRDLTIRLAGTPGAAANVVEVRNSEVRFDRCRICGAGTTGSGGGAGLFLAGTATGSVRGCRFDGNAVGVLLTDRTAVLFEGNTCRDNAAHGIQLMGSASGIVRGNTCIDNGQNGVVVEDFASPLVEQNVCEANGWNGIECSGSCDANVHHNTCQANRFCGIAVRHHAQPVLQDNECWENRDSGISYADNATGAAIDNNCTGNGKYGICIAQRSQPLLTTNTARENGDSGIAYFGGTAGTARGNTSTRNGHYGIFVGDQARPTVDSNTCERNRWAGLAFFSSAGGKALRNVCIHNGKHEIFVNRGAVPTLQANTSRATGPLRELAASGWLRHVPWRT